MELTTEKLNIIEIKTDENSSGVDNSQIELIAKYVKRNNYNELLQKFGPQTNHDLNNYRYPGHRGNPLAHESLSMDKDWNIFLWLYKNDADLSTRPYSNGPTGYHLLSKRIAQHNDQLALNFLNNLADHNDPNIQRQAKIHLARAWAMRLMKHYANPQTRQQCLDNCVALITDANFYWAMLFNLSHVDEKQRFIWGIIGLQSKFVQFTNTENENDFEQIRRWGIDHLCTSARYGHLEALNRLETHYINDSEFSLTALSNIIITYIRKEDFSSTLQWIEKLNKFIDPDKDEKIIAIYQHVLSDLKCVKEKSEITNNCKIAALKGLAHRCISSPKLIQMNIQFLVELFDLKQSQITDSIIRDINLALHQLPFSEKVIADWKAFADKGDAFTSFLYACYILKHANSADDLQEAINYFKTAANKGFPISFDQDYSAKFAMQWDKSKDSLKDKILKLFNGIINNALEASIARKIKNLKDPQADQIFVCLIQSLLETSKQDLRALDLQKMAFVMQRLLGFNSLHLIKSSNNDFYIKMAKSLSQLDKDLTDNSALHAQFANTWNDDVTTGLKIKTLAFLNEKVEKSKLGDFLNAALKKLPDDASIRDIANNLTDTLYEFSQFDELTNRETIYLQKITFINQQIKLSLEPDLEKDNEQASTSVQLKFAESAQNVSTASPQPTPIHNSNLEPVKLQFRLPEIFKSDQSDQDLQKFFESNM